jgi:hypothetical protein
MVTGKIAWREGKELKATAAQYSPFASKFRLKVNFSLIFLQMCIICCTFAGCFETEQNINCHNY